MKPENRILQALNDTDDALLADSTVTGAITEGDLGRHSHRWIPCVAAAVAILLIAGGIGTRQGILPTITVGATVESTRWPLTILNDTLIGHDSSAEDAVNSAATTIAMTTIPEELAIEEPWEDQPLDSKYREFVYNGITYYSQGITVPEDLVDHLVGSVDVIGYDYTLVEPEQHTSQADLYTLRDYSPDLLTALKLSDSENYYLYLRLFFDSDEPTLFKLLEGMNLQDSMKLTGAQMSFSTDNYQSTVRFDVPDDKIRDLFTEDVPATSEADIDIQYALRIEFSIPLCNSCWITMDDKGSLSIIIFNNRYCFTIDADRAKAFYDYVLNECPGTEERYYYGYAAETVATAGEAIDVGIVSATSAAHRPSDPVPDTATTVPASGVPQTTSSVSSEKASPQVGIPE